MSDSLHTYDCKLHLRQDRLSAIGVFSKVGDELYLVDSYRVFVTHFVKLNELVNYHWLSLRIENFRYYLYN